MAETIFVKLTEDEIGERGQTLANKFYVLDTLRLQKKETLKDITAEIKKVEIEISDLATTIRSGVEEREAAELPGIRKLSESKR